MFDKIHGCFAGGQPMLWMERSKFLTLRKCLPNSRFLVERWSWARS